MRSHNTDVDRILDAATRVFSHLGFHHTDVQKIAAELGIGKGTIYRKFPTKRKLFLACVERAMARLCVSIEEAIQQEQTSSERLAAAVYAYFGFFDQNPEVIELFALARSEFQRSCDVTLLRQDEWQLWMRVMDGLAADGKLYPGSSAKVCEFITQLLYGALTSRSLRSCDGLFTPDTPELIDFLLYGITGPSN
jgi:AcrR family transcriptional regulator